MADQGASASWLPLPVNDQRGVGYPRIRDGALEMGAVELGDSSLPPPGASGSGSNGFALSWWFAAVLAGTVAVALRRRVRSGPDAANSG